ncbi:MAG: hypothetical protein AAGA56_07840 [Myxococcota bacterium]
MATRVAKPFAAPSLNEASLRRFLMRTVVFAATGLGVACSSLRPAAPRLAVERSPTPTRKPDGRAAAARERSCRQLAELQCEGLQRCHASLYRAMHASDQGCIASLHRQCLSFLLTDTSVATPSQIAACIWATKTQTCSARIGALVAPCLIPGPRAAGQACRVNADCESYRCERLDRQGQCGVCQPAKRLGDRCTSGCTTPLQCVEGTCRRRAALGEACGSNSCAYPGTCVDGHCTARARVGERCRDDKKVAPRCDLGLTCEKGRCQAPVLAAPSEGCGPGIRCRGSACVAGVCTSRPDEGEPCRPGRFLACRPGLRCLEGRCTTVESLQCGPE